MVARNGYGDVASCNALGSNTFSNYIGLGLPWLTYNIVYGGRPYDHLQDDGVVASVTLLMIMMILYYIVVALNNWTLKAWYVYGVDYLSYECLLCVSSSLYLSNCMLLIMLLLLLLLPPHRMIPIMFVVYAAYIAYLIWFTWKI